MQLLRRRRRARNTRRSRNGDGVREDGARHGFADELIVSFRDLRECPTPGAREAGALAEAAGVFEEAIAGRPWYRVTWIKPQTIGNQGDQPGWVDSADLMNTGVMFSHWLRQTRSA